MGALVDLDGQPLRVRLSEPPPEHAARLFESLGVEVVLDPRVQRPCKCPRASGRTSRTRSQMTEETRDRMRDAYYMRDDKKYLARRRSGAQRNA